MAKQKEGGFSFWEGLFSGAMLVLGRVNISDMEENDI